MNIYSFNVQPWLRVDFVLSVTVRRNTIIFTDDIIKDKPLFISTILGHGIMEATRDFDLWEVSSPYLDWESIQRDVASRFDFVPECIHCSVRTNFCFDRYSEYDWLKQVAETIKLKDSNNDI